MASFNISKHPSANGSLCNNQIRFELYVDTTEDVRMQIEDRGSLGDDKVVIIGASELRGFAEGILEYLKAVGQ